MTSETEMWDLRNKIL